MKTILLVCSALLFMACSSTTTPERNTVWDIKYDKLFDNDTLPAPPGRPPLPCGWEAADESTWVYIATNDTC